MTGGLVGRVLFVDARLRGAADAHECGLHGGRHPVRRAARLPARRRRRQRHRHPAAADLLDAEDHRHHHAGGDLLGRAVRRLHQRHPVQHPRRTMVGGDDVRRPSAGEAGPRRRGAHRLAVVVLHRRVLRDHRADLPGADRRQFRARFRPAGILLGLSADLLQLRRHGPAVAVQGHLGDDARLRLCLRRHRRGHRRPAPDLRHRDAAHRLPLPDRGHRPVRHRRDPGDDREGPALRGPQRQDQSVRGVADLEEAAAILGHHRARHRWSASGSASRRAARRRPRS